MEGVYWAAAGVPDWRVLSISLPLGLLVANILYTHSMIDLEGDAASDKLTLAGLLKSPGAKLAMSWLPNFLPYLCVVAARIRLRNWLMWRRIL
jgi:1,4-dihydroxy-2-naphthoate octaprenyltransferase